MYVDLNLQFAIPEIVLASSACAILIITLFVREANRNVVAFLLSVLALAFTAVLVFFFTPKIPYHALNGFFVTDALSGFLKGSICLVTILAFVYGRKLTKERLVGVSEYYVLGLFSVVGMMVLASANNFLTIYLGLEMMSLSIYSMIGISNDNKFSSEAAMKYFVLGALASSVLLYGISLLYGLSGTLVLSEMSYALSDIPSSDLGLVLAVVFIAVAIAFKIGAVPFHMWVPDVYHGASVNTTVFISSVPKLAVLALTVRVFLGGIEDLWGMWQPILTILALLSAFAGNVIAIAQTNIKRMFAYSGIAHMGFFLFGFISGVLEGYAAALFYMFIYALMSCAGFGLINYLSTKEKDFDNLSDYAGFGFRRPKTAILMLILMLSMAGLPPTIGFFAKLSVINSLIIADFVWVAVSAVLFAVIGAFYYLRIIKLMYFDPPSQSTYATSPSMLVGLALTANILFLVLVIPWVNKILALSENAMLQVLF